MYVFYNQLTDETMLLKDFEDMRRKVTNQVLDIYNKSSDMKKERIKDVLNRLQTVENDAQMNLCLDMMFIYLKKERM